MYCWRNWFAMICIVDDIQWQWPCDKERQETVVSFCWRKDIPQQPWKDWSSVDECGGNRKKAGWRWRRTFTILLLAIFIADSFFYPFLSLERVWMGGKGRRAEGSIGFPSKCDLDNDCFSIVILSCSQPDKHIKCVSRGNKRRRRRSSVVVRKNSCTFIGVWGRSDFPGWGRGFCSKSTELNIFEKKHLLKIICLTILWKCWELS